MFHNDRVWLRSIGIFSICVVVISLVHWLHSPSPVGWLGDGNRITREQLADALQSIHEEPGFPDEIELHDGEKVIHGQLTYTIDWDCQEFISRELKRYHPDYGVFVAIDART